MNEIKPITIDDHELFYKYFSMYPPKISEFTFSNLFVWRKTRQIYFTEISNTLVLLVERASNSEFSKVIFGMPVGLAPLESILKQLGDTVSGAMRIVEEFTGEFRKAGMVIDLDRDNYDYIYKVSDLAYLKGRRYSKKRNHINKCLSLYNCEYISVSSKNIKELKDMFERWCKSTGCRENTDLNKEYHAIKELFEYFDEFKLIAGAIKVDGVIQAFAIAERLNNNTAVWHFEKALREYNGLNQLINHWFAKYGLSDYEFVNREQDLGLPGLRQAKMSYYPHLLLEKFNADYQKGMQHKKKVIPLLHGD